MRVIPINWGRYTGQTIDIIYIDTRGRFTQRRIAVYGLRGDAVRAYCYRRRGLRLFKLDRILAVSAPAGRRIG